MVKYKIKDLNFQFWRDRTTDMLMKDINTNGQKTPIKIIITHSEKNIYIRVDDGNHRCTAMLLLGMEEIDCEILSSNNI